MSKIVRLIRRDPLEKYLEEKIRFDVGFKADVMKKHEAADECKHKKNPDLFTQS